MNITYTQNGDYLIPNIIIRKTKPLGHYGRLRKAYLEMHRPILFNELVLSDKLFEHCAEIDETARNRMELIVRSLAEQNGVTEQLKAENQMEWVRQMNACKAQAEEIVKVELIYDWSEEVRAENCSDFSHVVQSCGRIVHEFYGTIYANKENGKLESNKRMWLYEKIHISILGNRVSVTYSKEV